MSPTPSFNPSVPQSPSGWALQKIRIYVPGPEGIIGTMEFNPRQSFDKAETALVYHYDHLGSIERLTPYGSNAVAYALDSEGRPGRYSYDAWGQRRNADTWSGVPASTSTSNLNSLTPRGYTGHEMLDDIGLVHMNGRIYDPLLGRMLSADRFVQAPMNLQSYNRYSYAMNNPLSFVDPTGFLVTVTAEKDKEGNIQIRITYTAKLVNESSTKMDAKKLEGIKTKLTDAIQKAWAGSIKGKSGERIEWSTEAKIEVVDDSSKASKEDHIISIKDKKDMPDEIYEKTGEMAKPDGAVDMTGKNIRNMILNSELTQRGRTGDLKDTGAHEFGHQLGLPHPNPSWREDKNLQLRRLWENNLMYQGQQEGASNVFQVQKAIDNFEKCRLNPWITKSEGQKMPEESAMPPQSKEKEDGKL